MTIPAGSTDAVVVNPTKRIAGNIAFMLSNDVVTRLTTFILYALIARFLGMREFGQMSLALTLLNTFQMIAPAGLKLFITREVSRDKRKTDLYIVNGNLVAIVTSSLSIVALCVLVLALDYETDTAWTILLVSLGLLPFSLCIICESIFQAWEKMHFIAQANIPRNIVFILLAVLILSRGYNIYFLGLLMPISYILMLGIERWLLVRNITRPRARLDPRFSTGMAKSASAFLGFQVIIAATGSFMYILLSKVGSESEVGLYNAATQLMAPVTLVYQSVVMSVFPLMCQKFDLGIGGLKRVSDRLIELLLTIAIPAAIALFFLAGDILLLIYGNAGFAQAAIIIRFLVVSLLLHAFTAVLGRVLLASHREKIVLRIVIIQTTITILLGFLLVSLYGLAGAVITALVGAVLDFALHYVETSKLFPNVIPWRSLWKAALASLGMIAILALPTHLNVWVAALLACGIYAGIWLGMAILSAGGIARLKTRYLTLWSE